LDLDEHDGRQGEWAQTFNRLLTTIQTSVAFICAICGYPYLRNLWLTWSA
jgi:hypothetical protein